MITRESMKQVLEAAVPRISWDTEQRLMEEGRLESLDILLIAARLYGEFHVEIPPQELTASNFDSLDALMRLYRRYEGTEQEPKAKRLV